MLKIVLLAYSKGIISSRSIEMTIYGADHANILIARGKTVILDRFKVLGRRFCRRKVFAKEGKNAV